MGWLALSLAVTVLLMDQATKALAVRALPVAANRGLWSGRAPSAPMLVGLWILALGCSILALATNPALSSSDLARAGLVVALAGATSNLCDRLRRGAVIDFIALGWWPAFNLADVAIVGGVAVLIGAAV
jgi:signal peptidase II